MSSVSLEPPKQSFRTQRRTAPLGCDLNRSMQHLNSNYREEDVANEVSNEDLLHRSR
jgi:hypothetical protein